MKIIKVILINLLLFTTISITAQESINIDTDWKLSIGLNKSSNSDIAFPIKVKGKLVENETTIWLSNSFKIPNSLKNSLLKVYIGDVPGVVIIYINGVNIGQEGSLSPKLFFHNPTPIHFFIPESLLKQSDNLIEISIYNNIGSFSMSDCAIGQIGSFDNIIAKKNIVNNNLYIAFSLFSLIIGLFYLLQFILTKKDIYKIYYALANIFLALYFADIGLQYRLLPLFIQVLIAKSSFSLFFGYLTLFFCTFFDVLNSKKSRLIITIVTVVIVLPYFILSKNSGNVLSLFSNLSLVAEIFLLVIIYISIVALKRKNRYALPISIGVFFAIGLSSLDIVAVIAGVRPEVWFQGIGIFGFNLSMFVVVAIKEMFIQRDLSILIEKNDVQSTQLQNLLVHIKSMFTNIDGLNSELTSSIHDTSNSVDNMSHGSNIITSSIDEQFKSVEHTNQSITDMFKSYNSMNTLLDRQFINIQQISVNITEMLSNNASVTKNLKDVVEQSQYLSKIAEDGEQAIDQSDKAILKIQDNSKSIYDVVKTVNDISERTNLLAMNAAIEAAHAGVSGKGFAVVAKEIKNLSNDSSKNANQIKLYMDTIIESIQGSVEVNNRTHEILNEINNMTILTVKKLNQAYSATSKQYVTSEEIKDSIGNIKDDSIIIKEGTENQNRQINSIQENLANLVNSSKQVKVESETIKDSSDVIVNTMDQLKELSLKSNKQSGELSKILKED